MRHGDTHCRSRYLLRSWCACLIVAVNTAMETGGLLERRHSSRSARIFARGSSSSSRCSADRTTSRSADEREKRGSSEKSDTERGNASHTMISCSSKRRRQRTRYPGADTTAGFNGVCHVREWISALHGQSKRVARRLKIRSSCARRPRSRVQASAIGRSATTRRGKWLGKAVLDYLFNRRPTDSLLVEMVCLIDVGY